MRTLWAPLVAAAALVMLAQPGDPLEEGFRNPPMTSRPAVYYLLLNGYVNRDYLERELAEYHRAGIGGLCIFDMGARGDPGAQPPAGPAFLGPESVASLAHVIRTAGKLGMEVDLSVSSSWDMGASWVKPEDGSMTLVESRLDLSGPREFDAPLPFPEVPEETPKGPDGAPLFHQEAALLAVPEPGRLPGYEFLLQLERPWPQRIDRVVLFNTRSGERQDYFAKDFTVTASAQVLERGAFREIVSGALEAREGPQEFRFPPVEAKYVRLQIRSGHNPASDRVQLAEFEVWSTGGRNVALSHRVNRDRDGAELLHYSSALGQLGPWSAGNIHDARTSGARGSWSSPPTPPLHIGDHRRVVDLTRHVDAGGRLRWPVPPGRWTILRYVVTNTGERLKVPSPNSDGLATDHFNEAVTERYIQEVIDRLRPGIGDFRRSALRELYLASYEVRGQVWTPRFLEEFRRRRGYDLTPFLPALRGGLVDNEEITERVIYDFRKTQGELLVDAYYRAAVRTAARVGLGVESEAGGPGPPIHQVPVDALMALGAVTAVRGEFWPYRPDARAMWVIKETASAAHIYGKPRVHMEAFTSMRHWEEGPQDLKPSADRAFCEGMNHVVWHTASHQPPEAGKPGWVYHAGTHVTPNVTWWPMAKPFLDYLARASFLLQQGLFVGDVLYYYGDQGYNFVGPKEVDPSLGFGYDYDVTNAEVLLTRLGVRDGRLALPDGVTYEVLVLPERTDIDLAVLTKIGEFVRAGATVAGPKPRRSTGYSGYPQRDSQVAALANEIWGGLDGQAVRERRYGAGKVVWGRPLREVMADRGVGPDFRFSSPQPDTALDFIHRRTSGADIYFVRNQRRRWENIEATFRVRRKKPELWDPATGEMTEALTYKLAETGVTLPLRLEPDGSVFVVFRRTASGNASASSPEADPREPIPVAGPWTVRFPDGWGAPPSLTLDRLISWTEHPDPGVRFFSGIAECRTEVSVPAAWLPAGRRTHLDLGELWAVAEVELNGRNLGVAWKRPFRLEATAALRPGANTLLVRVANNWVNRLLGDSQSSGGPRFTRTNVRPPAAAPRSSGLFGPVRLEPASEP
jgi:hypothetical protein